MINNIWKNKNIKIVRVVFFSIIVFLSSFVYWSYQDFLEKLKYMSIDISSLENKNWISRYEVTRLLNSIECKDCIKPNNDIINKYNNSFWTDFSSKQWKNFWDITYLWANFKWLDYYYCVSYVWTKWYMKWYPKEISPICAWKFCWQKTITKAEFLQVIVNLLSNYIYNKYSVNWKNVNKRVNKLKPKNSEYTYLNSNDRKIIQQNSKKCDWVCKLKNPDEFKVYLKYCMYNIKKCWMREFWKIKQAVRPVAEFNILYNQSIIDMSEAKKWNIHNPVEWKFVIKTLSKLDDILQCSFNNDYDCDGVPNSEDNCYLAFNKKQSDSDNDWIGDVCDSDIDNDWVLNPVWIVDDNWNFNISKVNSWMDNCIFVSNKDQKYVKNSKIWEKCINKEKISAFIKTSNFNTKKFPIEIEFEAMVFGRYKNIIWNIWDWTNWIKWKKIKHIFSKPGIYTITAKIEWIYNTINIVTSVNIWKPDYLNYYLQINPSKTVSNNIENISFFSKNNWDYDYIQWEVFSYDKKIQKNKNQGFSMNFTRTWTFFVKAKWFKNWKIKSISVVNVWLWKNSMWSYISTKDWVISIGEDVVIQTTFWWFKLNDIQNILRNWWDGSIENWKKIVNKHSYWAEWEKIIVQKIKLKNWMELENVITVNIFDKNSVKSFWINLIPTKTNLKQWDKNKYKIYFVWGVPDNINLMNFFDWVHLNKHKKTIKGSDFPFFIEDNIFYWKEQSFSPYVDVYFNSCDILKNQIVMVWNTKNICETLYENWENKKYKCDLDKDWIPDICDDDIDWDWKKNLIGIITKENSDCSINSWNINYDLLKEHFFWYCSLDNCFYSTNSGQDDLNMNWIWDKCENMWILKNIEKNIDDEDNDWIIWNKDLCPDLPETFNNYLDLDGCPDINENCIWNISTIWDSFYSWNYWNNWNQNGWNGNNWNWSITTECLQCPCPYVEYWSDLYDNIKIKAVLKDRIYKNIIYDITFPIYLKLTK